MMRLKRFAGRALLSGMLLSALGATAFLMNLDRLAKNAVEQHTTAALNLPTTVESVSVHALLSEVDFKGFRIASPRGFNTPDMLLIPSAEVEIAYSELRREPIHIKSITMIHPRLVIESDGTVLNLKRMVDGIPHAVHPVHLVVDQVTVKDAVVVLRNLPGVHGEVAIPVETFTVRDLGIDHPNGLLIKEAVTRLVTALAIHASDSPQMPGEYRAIIRGDIGQIVRNAIPIRLPPALSALLGGNDAGKPAGVTKPGLFGLGLLGHTPRPATQPNN